MSKLPKRQRSRRVRWSQWADGRQWRLTPGVDHEQPARDALKAARVWAVKHGFFVDAELPGTRASADASWVISFRVREDTDG